MYASGQQINSIGGKLLISKRPPEEVLATAYIRLKQEGLLDTVWYSRPVSLSEFLAWAKVPNNITYAGFFQAEGSDKLEICGLGWLTEVTSLGTVNRGEVGMAFLREWWKQDIPLELSRMMMEDGFNHENLVVVFGTIPVNNPAAIRFARKIGMRAVGTAPRFVSWHGEPGDAVISYVTKEEWFREKVSESGHEGA